MRMCRYHVFRFQQCSDRLPISFLSPIISRSGQCSMLRCLAVEKMLIPHLTKFSDIKSIVGVEMLVFSEKYGSDQQGTDVFYRSPDLSIVVVRAFCILNCPLQYEWSPSYRHPFVCNYPHDSDQNKHSRYINEGIADDSFHFSILSPFLEHRLLLQNNGP